MDIQPMDHILEIGPGKGILTKYLIESLASTVTAVEKDKRLIPFLQKQFNNDDRFHLIHQDFLKIKIQSLRKQETKFRCISNLPYRVTSPILFYLLDNREYISDMTVMVQKEVGERLSADTGSRAYGIPSVLFQAVSDIKMLFTVSRNAFRPVPEVTSAVLRIKFLEGAAPPISNWSHFQSMVKVAFNQRRKMLRKTLRQKIGRHEYPIELTRRPQQLSVSEWIELANFFTKQNPS